MREGITRDKFGKFITSAKIKKIENEMTREVGRRVLIVLTLLCFILYLAFSIV